MKNLVVLEIGLLKTHFVDEDNASNGVLKIAQVELMHKKEGD